MRVGTCTGSAAPGINSIHGRDGVERQLLRICQRLPVRLSRVGAVRVLDDDLAAHLGVDITEVVDHSSMGSICHGLRDR